MRFIEAFPRVTKLICSETKLRNFVVPSFKQVPRRIPITYQVIQVKAKETTQSPEKDQRNVKVHHQIKYPGIRQEYH